MVTILLVEDDLTLTRLILEFLSGYDMRVIQAENEKQLMNVLSKGGSDVIIMDLMLPEEDGLSLIRTVRTKSDIPIIISSARDDLGSKITGYEFGADDYLAKPYEPRELALHIQAILRRIKKVNYKIGEFDLDEEAREIRQAGYLVELTRIEYEIFKTLLMHPGRAFSRNELGWEAGQGENHRSIDAHVKNIRQKIGDTPKTPRYIAPVWGIGYKFIG
jgi:DNA-binding response OmpR family regulator